MDFAERQEAMAIAAVFDAGSLQRRFDPRYLGEVDVTFELLAGTCFVVEILKSIARLNHHPGLFRVAGIDKRSEERRVGIACVRTCRFGWLRFHYKQQNE